MYYIANDNTSSGTDDNIAYSNAPDNRKYYLVPADNPQQPDKRDAWYSPNHANSAGVEDKPFLTTYKTNKDNATVPSGVTVRAHNSVWIVKKTSDGYYYVIHAATGKYVIYEVPLPNDPNVNNKPAEKDNGKRKTMHLQTPDNETYSLGNNENYKFTITRDGEENNYIYRIQPKNRSGWYWNPASSNKDKYYGQTANIFQAGLVGVYNGADDGGSKWHFEDALCQPPTINFNSTTGSYTITTTLQCDYKIRYTTNGDDPTISSPEYDRSTIVVDEAHTVKAIITGYGMVLSGIATMLVSPAPLTVPTFSVNCDNQLEINCDFSEANIYYTYTTDGNDPSDPNNSGNGTLYTGPIVIADGAKVKAKYYYGTRESEVSDVYIFSRKTASPTISLDGTTATITFTEGTLYYTINGTDPVINGEGVFSSTTSPASITVSESEDVDIRAIAKLDGREQSCPIMVKRPKTPSISAISVCDNLLRSHTLTFTDTEDDKTYWYSLSNGSGQTAPALDSFIEYTPGSPVDISAISTWNGNSVTVTLHAYAKDAEGYTSSIIQQDYLLKYTDAPMITHSGNTVTITNTGNSAATINYSVDGGAEQTYSTPFTVSNGQSHIITATAQYGTEGKSCETIHTITLSQTITTLDQLKNMSLDGAYVLGGNIDGATSYTSKGTDTTPFTGSFDGAGYTISGLTQPLFGTTDGAVIHNVNLKNVSTSGEGNVGAIVCDAKGYTRIYNCGILPNDATFPSGTHPSVTATGTGGCAGGIVGKLEDDSRVVNCFSYADVSSTGIAAGIVGNNTYASDASVSGGKYHKLKTMVVNCMFYGNITNGSPVYPVYGGQKINNTGANGINNYNFYSEGCTFAGGLNSSNYYCSWPAKKDYLTRYEFYRNLLNSNRELCSWWVGAPYAPSTMTTNAVKNVSKDASLMAKWVFDSDVAPYPILAARDQNGNVKSYHSVVNIDADASWRNNANEWEGKNLGSIKVTINPGTYAAGGASTKSNIDFVITDMDTLRADYCYRKIQLPYYNTVFGSPNGVDWAAKYGGNYGEYVVVGWDISNPTGTIPTISNTKGTDENGVAYDHTYTENWQTGYNFADRYCTTKDEHRIFAQGGYYYVPEGVTSITITAHWAKAIYLDNTDHYYDRVSVSSFVTQSGVSVGSSSVSPFEPAGTRPETLGNGKNVHNGSISDNLPSGSVYENAIVLVGNHQYFTGANDIGSDTKGCTIMSADFDFDDEPDYCLEWQLGNKTTRQSICPIRFDFLPVLEMGLAMKEDGSTQYYSLGCYRPLGHFEVTETSLIHFGQFEFSNVRTSNSPIILNGGIFDQYTKGTEGSSNASNDKITYIILGGNVRMPSFTPGAHLNKNYSRSTRHCAVNVLGGNIDYLYLTGNYNENVTPSTDNPHCYIDGGRFKQVAAAGKEGINGDVYFNINHAKIWEFYGGSTMDQADDANFKIVKGNINVTIDNSMVDKYCGGPKFGNMVNGKTVTTRATGTTFGVYYGGGNGGTSYVQYSNTDGEQPVSSNFNWNGTGKLNDYNPGSFRDEATGYMADYDMEIVNTSAGTNANRAVYRTYFYAAQFSATNTGSITNNLTNCKVLTNFYGGGNLGGVIGDVTSTLDGTTRVYGSVFGAGFSATVPDVTIHEKDKNAPTINVNTGIITPQSGGSGTIYTWTNKTTINETNLSTSSPTVTDTDGKKYYFTTKSLDNLGAVSGNVILNIEGSTSVECKEVEKDSSGNIQYDASGNIMYKATTSGGVFGGGDQSSVTGNVTVTLKSNAQVAGDVFGGGNKGEVGGSTTVKIED